jgi:pimeloyl-ACP methyl ester carboxylesterase
MTSCINSWIFYPPHLDNDRFAELNKGVSRLLEIPTADGNVCCAIFGPANTSVDFYSGLPKTTLIWCHGNACDIGTQAEYFKLLANQLNITVVAVEYFGYGPTRYTHTPTEQGCYNSLEAVVEHLMDGLHFDINNIHFVGQSLGTGVVIDFVSKHEIKNSIMLISPYKTIARVIYDSFLVYPVDKFCSWYKLGTVNCPVKMYHGKADIVIPWTHTRDLYNHLNDKTLTPTYIEDVGHNDILTHITLNAYKMLMNLE